MRHALVRRGIDRVSTCSRRLAGAARRSSAKTQKALDLDVHLPSTGEYFALFAYSVMFCLPDGLASKPSVGTGDANAPRHFRRYAGEAGFSRVTIGPVEHDSF